MRRFDLLEPSGLDQALKLLQDYGDDARLLGGGVMLAILLRERLIAPRALVSLREIPDLDDVDASGGELRLGASATIRRIERSDAVAAGWPVLAEAARLVGNVRVRTMATIGGHLAQADPHLDLPPVLVALRARAEIARLDAASAGAAVATRMVPVADVATGYYETQVAANEAVIAVEVPPAPADLRGAYLKYCSLSEADWPTVGVAAFLRNDQGRMGDVRIVAGGVAERPLEVPEAEALLEGEAPAAALIAEVARRYAAAADPLENARGSAEYKREMTAVFVRRAVATAAERAGLPLTEEG
jgi:carbon-monoxide dehydrogenase medium subunit